MLVLLDLTIDIFSAVYSHELMIPAEAEVNIYIDHVRIEASLS